MCLFCCIAKTSGLRPAFVGLYNGYAKGTAARKNETRDALKLGVAAPFVK